jgi:hypothetical protein
MTTKRDSVQWLEGIKLNSPKFTSIDKANSKILCHMACSCHYKNKGRIQPDIIIFAAWMHQHQR